MSVPRVNTDADWDLAMADISPPASPLATPLPPITVEATASPSLVAREAVETTRVEVEVTQAAVADPEAAPAGGCGVFSACSTCGERVRAAAKALKQELLVLYYASQDPRVGCLPRLLVGIALAYALSPLDLIPDFIPVIGVLDDLILLPALLWLALKLIPKPVLAAARKRAETEPLRLGQHRNAAVAFLIIWLMSFLATAAILIEKWPLARAHAPAIYALAVLCFLAFAMAGIYSESARARDFVQRVCCCKRRTALAEPLLPA